MEKVRIRKIIEDIIITQFLNSEIDIVHDIDGDMETIKDMTDLVYKIITEGYGK